MAVSLHNTASSTSFFRSERRYPSVRTDSFKSSAMVKCVQAEASDNPMLDVVAFSLLQKLEASEAERGRRAGPGLARLQAWHQLVLVQDRQQGHQRHQQSGYELQAHRQPLSDGHACAAMPLVKVSKCHRRRQSAWPSSRG